MALIAVSGHLKDVSGANIAGSVVFQLVNYGASIPRVIGTNALVPTNVTFTAAASGAWSGNIQGNDSIDPGASNTPPTTYYVCQFRDANGANIQSVAFNFTGAGPSNLDSQAPLVTIPLLTAPPNTAALLASNNTFTGTNTFTGVTNLTGGGSFAVAKADSISQSANIGSVTLLTPAGGGFYRINGSSAVTRAATTSSTMPGIVIAWTDADSSQAMTFGLTSQDSSNILTAIQSGFVMVNAKAATAISYSTTGYASVGATSMQYSVHVRVEGPT